MTNGRVTHGDHLSGFTDRDFDAARYTAQGIYLQMRFKFDQNTRWGRPDATSTAGADPREAGNP
ncbi:MAG: hypothetical protein ABL878_00670 [Burkholderiales bacterium]